MSVLLTAVSHYAEAIEKCSANINLTSIYGVPSMCQGLHSELGAVGGTKLKAFRSTDLNASDKH